LRLGSTVYELCSFRLKDSSVTSVTVKMAFFSGGSIPPPSARGRRGTNLQQPPGAEPSRCDCGALLPSNTARHRGGPTTMHRTRKVPRTAREATKYPAPKEIAVRATRRSRMGLGLRLGPTVSELYSFRLKDRSVSSVTVQMAFLVGGGIRIRLLGYGGARQRRRPRGRDDLSRRNEPSRYDCAAPRPSYTARHWAGSTTTHRRRKVTRTLREATNYHAPKEIDVRAPRGSRRRPGLGGWVPRSKFYAPFV
jgi:hypothetical protein